MQYKNFLESLIIDESVTDVKLRSKQVLKDVDILPGDITTKYTLIFPTSEDLDQSMSDLETFEKTFKLSHTITTGNMHLFNVQGIMTKYATAEEILKEYCDVRLNFYMERKKLVIHECDVKLSMLSEKIRFITMVNQKQLEIRDQNKVEISSQLETNHFMKFTNQNKTKNKKKSTTDEEAEVGEEELSNEEASYDYLLRMPIWSLTKERVEKLRKEQEQVQKELELLFMQPPVNKCGQVI